MALEEDDDHVKKKRRHEDDEQVVMNKQKKTIYTSSPSKRPFVHSLKREEVLAKPVKMFVKF